MKKDRKRGTYKKIVETAIWYNKQTEKFEWIKDIFKKEERKIKSGKGRHI